MTLLRSIGAVATASDDRAIDWGAVVEAASAATPPGSVDLDADERADLADDVRAATGRIRTVSGLSFDGPEAIEAMDRHHWIDANVDTFRGVLAPLEDRHHVLPGIASRANTAAMAGSLAFLARHVMGQYDPPLFGEGPPRLSIVPPNVDRAADVLSVEPERFRRWIVLHEVVHVAEFQAAPWLRDHLSTRVEDAVEGLAGGDLHTDAFREVDLAMTVVEGYAEFLMDRAFEGPVDDLREKLDARRRGGGPLAMIMRRLLGLGLKRRQYERGRRFFDTVEAARGEEAAAVVWRGPESMPTRREIKEPARWIDRLDP